MKKILLIILILILSFTLVGNCWDCQYEGNVEPDSDGWILGGTDYASVAGGILTIETTEDAQNCFYYKTNVDVDFDIGSIFQFRAKFTLDAHKGFFFRIRDGTQDEYALISIHENIINYFNTEGEWILLCSGINTEDDFHVYRVEVLGTTATLYMDEVDKGSWTVNAGTYGDLVGFGDHDIGQHGKLELDYFYYTAAEEVSEGDAIFFGTNF